MADLSNVKFDPQNPDALFSPDQWTNAYSQFSGKALPWPSSYAGYPTDAMGNPINPQAGSGIPDYAQWQANQAAPPAGGSATPGTTINSMPAQPQGGTGLDAALGAWGMTQQGQQMGAKGISQQDIASLIGLPGIQNIMGPQQAAPQAAPPPPANNLTYPQVLSMLANPGKVTTQGATVPAGPSAQPGPGALQSFLQNVGTSQAGPRAGFQQSFANTLKGMGY